MSVCPSMFSVIPAQSSVIHVCSCLTFASPPCLPPVLLESSQVCKPSVFLILFCLGLKQHPTLTHFLLTGFGKNDQQCSLEWQPRRSISFLLGWTVDDVLKWCLGRAVQVRHTGSLLLSGPVLWAWAQGRQGTVWVACEVDGPAQKARWNRGC